MPDMKAAVMYKPGGPEVLQIELRPIPKPNDGQVLIRVMAFGLNRSEMFTRQGFSPGVQFPAFSASRRLASSRKRQERASPKAMSSRP